MKKNLFIFCLCFVPAFLMAQTVPFSDNFDSYSVGKYLCEQSSQWGTWSSSPGGVEDAIITDKVASSAPNSLKIEGVNDIIYNFGDLTSGDYEISFNMFIPSSSESAYFNMIHKYTGSQSSTWGPQFYLFPNTKKSYIAVNGQTFYFENPPADKWFPIVLHFDIDNNEASITINDVLALEWPFDQTAYNGESNNNLAVIDFYGNEALYYIDDFNVKNYQADVSCPTPEKPVISNITGHTADITWKPKGEETSWELQYKAAANSWESVTVNTPSYKFEDLPGMTTTTVRVRALCSETDMSKWTSTTFTTDISCHTPKYLTATEITRESAKITWIAVGEETSWELSIGENKEILTPTIVNDKPTYTFENLTPKKTYYLTIRAICAVKDTSLPEYSFFTTLDYECVAPIELSFKDIEKTKATASWKSVGQEDAWFIQYRKAGETTWKPQQFVTSPTYTFSDLQAGCKYEVRIQSSCSDYRVSDFLNGEFETLEPDTCATPTQVAAKDITTNSAVLTWDQKEDSANEWEVMYKVKGASKWEKNLTISAKTATLDGLKHSTTYEAAIIAHCVNGVNSEMSNTISFTTIAETCDAPTNLQIKDVTHHSAVLTWSQTEGTANEWVVNHRAKGASDWTSQTVTTTSATLDNLEELTSYEAMVVAHCTNGVNSDNSETVVFTTEKNAINDYSNSNIRLYPNPTTGIISCDLSNAGKTSKVDVYDVYGKLLQSISANGETLTIDASDYADGVYFVRIYTENGTINKTFIKK